MATNPSSDEGYRLTVEQISETLAAYLYLPTHPNSAGCVARTVRLGSILDYKGPDIALDLDASGAVIGIKIIS